MFPVSGVIQTPSGGGSTPPPDLSGYVTSGTLASTLSGYVTTGALTTALANVGSASGIVTNATKDSNGIYVAATFKNALIIVSPNEGYFGNPYAVLQIAAPSSDMDEYQFTVINTGTVPLRLMNTQNDSCHFVNGNSGQYQYGNVSTMNIAIRGAHLILRVNSDHSNIAQLAGGLEETGWPVAAMFEYPL